MTLAIGLIILNLLGLSKKKTGYQKSAFLIATILFIDLLWFNGIIIFDIQYVP
ncbi:hypothetical protein [Clostridium tetani]|uniref:hypothetical protein n=1 Tax=Clostridium tetani TaxID=1513 RepID=UPI000A52EF39|nr:hypothetical protein [Clostridium tetani]WFN61962.1 hypothetical protein PAA20_00340 [Clostridium tetani]